MASYHSRSLSLPSTSHPVVDQLDDQLCRLRSSQAASTSSLTSKLTKLNDLYKCVDEFLKLPHNQKTYSEKWVEEVLGTSLRLLDICLAFQDVLAQSKERLQGLQSVIRRRCSGELNMTNEFSYYLKNRKIAKKAIKKCLKDIKEVEKSHEANVNESKLKDVQVMTVDVFMSLLSYIGGSDKCSWSFSKMVRQKPWKQTASPISKFESVDATLELMVCQKKKANVDMSQVVQLDSEIQEIDVVLQCLFRHLVKTRATLLNFLVIRENFLMYRFFISKYWININDYTPFL